MKKIKNILYAVLIAAELFVGSLLMSSLWMSGLYLPIAFAAVAVVALFVWQIVLLRRTEDASARWKILWNVAFIALIPTAVFVITYIVVAIAFIIAFAA